MIMKLGKIKIWILLAVLTICGTASFASCSSNEDNTTEQSNISVIADKVWAFSQTHPDGFTIDIRTMTEAFNAYVSCLHQLYLFGAAMQLNRMGYHMTKTN